MLCTALVLQVEDRGNRISSEHDAV